MALATAEGAHPKAIQTRMGHSSINVTLDRYGHLFPELDDAIAVSMKGKGAQSRQPELWGATAEKELVDINWVATRLGVKVRHVRRLVAEKRIPLIKWGHLLRFDPDEIEQWIDEARKPPHG